ncbi:hypothetical protein Lser_V15G20738 [Lactuca serriola]
MVMNFLFMSKTEDSDIKLTEFGLSNFIKPGASYLIPRTDGVGTKLKLALETGIHDSIGIDLVGMSVNDIITSRAKPLFFLDYYATSRLHVDLVEKDIKGFVDGYQQFDCALLGGETAKCQIFMQKVNTIFGGFVVGIVKKEMIKNLKAPMKVFGDLHGQFGDLMGLFDEYVFPSTSRDNIQYPQNVHLIRGNHVLLL